MTKISRKILLAAILNGTALSPAFGMSCDQPGLVGTDCGTENHENCAVASTSAGVSQQNQAPLRISIDGGDNDACIPDAVSLVQHADIRMSYDGLDATPLLNVGLAADRKTVQPGQAAQFVTYWNYSHWIDAAEIRIFGENDSSLETPLAVLSVDGNDGVLWRVPEVPAPSYNYVLRVYDENGSYDETNPKAFSVNSQQASEAVTAGDVASSIYGTDNTGLRNIPVRGARVTVSGVDLDKDRLRAVHVFGAPVPVNPQGGFVAQEILPTGKREVRVTIAGHDGQMMEISREIGIPEDDLFLIALGELTIGQRSDDGSEILAADGEEFDETFVTGRGAFYLKGKIRGDYLLTAALDTTEDDVDNLFSNLDDKDPESLLRRVDPDRFYPVYGDDSTYLQDAPTQGRFYVRLERGDDHVVWGNFVTNITGTEFAQIDRGLYGGKLEYNSDQSTSFGERKSRLTAFTADPGTLPAREEFRGTGGSVYFLQNQDLTIGSERLRVEIRDRISGLVMETQDLEPQKDYDIDYIQGRVLLNRPLVSTVRDNSVVRDGTLPGDNVYLVVRYEFTPTFSDIGGFITGGRGETWLTEQVRFGATVKDQNTTESDGGLVAGDLLLRKSNTTYLKAEFAESTGTGFGERASFDGGFTFDALTNGAVLERARARRIEIAADHTDFESVAVGGKTAAYYEKLDQGFAGVGRLTQSDTFRYGAETTLAFSDANSLSLSYDHVDIAGRGKETSATADLRRAMTARLSVGLGLRHSDREGPAAVDSGVRSDIGLELSYQPADDVTVFGFVQNSIERSDSRRGGQRAGIGLDAQLSEKVSASLEVSGGDGGTGALVGLTYVPREGEEYYLNYALDADRRESGLDGTTRLTNSENTLTAGGRRRYSDYLSVYGEERASFGNRQGLTHAYGADFTPGEKLSVGLGFEIGNLEESDQLIEREAYTLSAGYTDEGLTIGSAFEWRDDRADGVARETWLFRSNLGLQLSDNWRALAKLNHAESDGTGGNIASADFTEAQLGGAYRPINNDRFNALFRYTYFRDLAPGQQVSAAGQTGLPAQRSQILSLDAQYDLTPWLSVGGKYGYRFGEVSVSRAAEDFVDSTAQLAILRGDLHLVRQWDGLLELRTLEVQEAQDRLAGLLVAVYRHVGDHAKVGLGYNFTEFSDDLTDFGFDNQGWFVNIIGKY